MDHMLGGFSGTKDATEEIQKLCDQVKPGVEVKTGKIFKEFIAVSYSRQVVAGAKFIIKVHVGGDNYILLSVFQALPRDGGAVELKDVQENKTKEDPLTPF